MKTSIISSILYFIFVLCMPQTITDFEGNDYNTVVIGDQTWMAENLKSLHDAQGNIIDSVWAYNENEDSVADYGRLYTWYATIKGYEGSDDIPSGIQGICPEGWHIPSEGEWNILIDYLGGQLVAGGKLKEDGIAHWQSPNTGATNESGFSGLPGGYKSDWQTFDVMGFTGFWWSSTKIIHNEVTYYNSLVLGHEIADASIMGTGNLEEGYSVRCVKDETTYIDPYPVFNKIEIYPNPCQDYIKILNTENKCNVSIFTPEGKLVFQKEISDQKLINLVSLSRGLYIIQIDNEFGQKRIKLIKNQ